MGAIVIFCALHRAQYTGIVGIPKNRYLLWDSG
jgi:hypothetical protein